MNHSFTMAMAEAFAERLTAHRGRRQLRPPKLRWRSSWPSDEQPNSSEAAAATALDRSIWTASVLPSDVEFQRIDLRELIGRPAMSDAKHIQRDSPASRFFRAEDFCPNSFSGLAGIGLASLLGWRTVAAAEPNGGAAARRGNPAAGWRNLRRRRNACCRFSAPAARRTSICGSTNRRWKSITASRCPARRELVTFQGKNGNLMKSPWPFAPAGQSGKMISTLLAQHGPPCRTTSRSSTRCNRRRTRMAPAACS